MMQKEDNTRLVKVESFSKQQFNLMLKTANLSKKEFAEILGTTGGTISNWGNEDRDIPYWVESWLKLYIENQQCRKIKEAIKESGVCKEL
ncbi:MAG: XRE family transcriptional regulator [Sulfuricurvum sp.]|nr:XRE family transcriptional regulator [Sulfuricurvum sp.]